MPNTYTVSAGDHAKLLTTSDGTTRTVTSLRGLDAAAAATLARSLTEVENTLTAWTADPDAFADQATRLGLRKDEVTDGTALTLSRIADLPGPRTPVSYAPDTHRIAEVAAALTVINQLPVSAQRAAREELRALLGKFDGPVLPVSFWSGDGVITLNAATWVAQATTDELSDIVIGGWPDNCQAVEQIAWHYSSRGQVVDGAAQHVLAADQDLQTVLDVSVLVRRLAFSRPEALRSMLAEVDADELALDPDQEEAVSLAREVIGA